MCLFVCFWGCIVQLDNFSLIWRRHHFRWKTTNVDLCSAHMAIEQGGFFSVPRLLWHWVSIYNGHLRGPVTLTFIAKRLAVELPLPFFMSYVFRGFRSSKADLILDIYLEIITFWWLLTGNSNVFDNRLINDLEMHLDNISWSLLI